MAYWGQESAENDYASLAVGAYVYLITERMFKGIETVIEKRHPEQGIVASVQCLRMLAKSFPNSVRVHFRAQHLKRAKDAFDRWYELVEDKLPEQYRSGIRESAHAEFQLFETEVLGQK